MALTSDDIDIEVRVLSAWQEKQQKRGSPLNDWFRWFHKQLGTNLYGADLDLCIHERTPPGLAAVLDFKGPDEEGLGFSHVQVYNALMKRWPVFVVELRNQVEWRDLPLAYDGTSWMQRVAHIDDQDNPVFQVARYLGGDWRPYPPKVALTEPEVIVGLAGFRSWEWKVRQWWRKWPQECQQGEHGWRWEERRQAPWGLDWVMKCDRCHLFRFSDPCCEKPPMWELG